MKQNASGSFKDGGNQHGGNFRANGMQVSLRVNIGMSRRGLSWLVWEGRVEEIQ